MTPAEQKMLDGTVAHQRRDMGLLNAKYCPRLSLREVAIFDDAVDLQCGLSLELLAFQIGETDVGEHVAAAFFEGHAFFLIGIVHAPLPQANRQAFHPCFGLRLPLYGGIEFAYTTTTSGPGHRMAFAENHVS